MDNQTNSPNNKSPLTEDALKTEMEFKRIQAFMCSLTKSMPENIQNFFAPGNFLCCTVKMPPPSEDNQPIIYSPESFVPVVNCIFREIIHYANFINYVPLFCNNAWTFMGAETSIIVYPPSHWDKLAEYYTDSQNYADKQPNINGLYLCIQNMLNIVSNTPATIIGKHFDNRILASEQGNFYIGTANWMKIYYPDN